MRVSTIGDAQLLYGSRATSSRTGGRRGSTPCSRDAWRERGFGDFWGYALVAEGAAEAMVEVGPPLGLAAPVVLVEEAGGRATDLQGVRTIHAGSALSTNGVLHDEIVEKLKA